MIPAVFLIVIVHLSIRVMYPSLLLMFIVPSLFPFNLSKMLVLSFFIKLYFLTKNIPREVFGSANVKGDLKRPQKAAE